MAFSSTILFALCLLQQVIVASLGIKPTLKENYKKSFVIIVNNSVAYTNINSDTYTHSSSDAYTNAYNNKNKNLKSK